MDLTPQREVGRLAEARFFEVVQADGIAPWFCGIQPPSVQQDAFGIDAIATIKRRITGELVSIPVQIKSSGNGVCHHLIGNLEHWLLRFVFVIVNDGMSDSSICRQLRARLDHPRKHSYTYDDLFREIERKRLNLLATKLMEARAKVNLQPGHTK